MLDRELTYQMPFERLVKLSRTASRKAYSVSWYAIWALAAAYIAAIALLVIFAPTLDRVQADLGVPDYSGFLLAGSGVLFGLWMLRRYGLKQMRGRADYDSAVRFRREADGLRFATSQVEYYVKWDGISQMLVEPDAIVFSHGSLFFPVPNTAFTDAAERIGLVRDVFGRLNAQARARSEKFIRPLLDATADTAGV